MKLTKYEHACFTIEHEGKLLIVDPGVYTSNLTTPENVTGVVVTHEHSDHFDSSALGAIIAHNPEAVIIGPASVTRQLEGALPTQTVQGGDSVHVEAFHLQFFEAAHAEIHDSVATPQNVGVLVNKTVYYGGDSLVVPDAHVDTLALPAAAPWLKLSETAAYLQAVKPRFAFPTHDAILSSQGKELVDRLLLPIAQTHDTHYQRIDGQVATITQIY